MANRCLPFPHQILRGQEEAYVGELSPLPGLRLEGQAEKRLKFRPGSAWGPSL